MNFWWVKAFEELFKPQALHFYRLYMFFVSKLPPPQLCRRLCYIKPIIFLILAPTNILERLTETRKRPSTTYHRFSPAKFFALPQQYLVSPFQINYHATTTPPPHPLIPTSFKKNFSIAFSWPPYLLIFEQTDNVAAKLAQGCGLMSSVGLGKSKKWSEIMSTALVRCLWWGKVRGFSKN